MQGVESGSVPTTFVAIFIFILVGEESLCRAGSPFKVTKRDADGLFRVVEDEFDVTFESNIFVEDDSGVRWDEDRAHSSTEHESIGAVIRSTSEVLLEATFAFEIEMNLNGLFDAARGFNNIDWAHIKHAIATRSRSRSIRVLRKGLGGTGKSESSDSVFHHCCL